MKLILATNNAHKKIEFSGIFIDHEIRVPEELGIGFDCEETGTSFLENSLLKSRSLYELVHAPVIADDSGLCVPALKGEPGIYSARYGSVNGHTLEAAERNAYLLEKMKGISDRRCFFVCCMTLILDEYRIFSAQETLEGVLLEAPRGKGGFGYDPVVYLPGKGKTVAELNEKEKNAISHRGKAGAVLSRMLSSAAR
jgi:XTP/dITP diphosphohydrolase